MAKGSDNPFPSVLIAEGTEPSAPSAGQQRLYIDSTSHHLSATNSSGTERDLETSGAPAESAVTFTDITTNNASTSKHGYLKKLDNTAAHFMDGTGAWSTPAGAGLTGSETFATSTTTIVNTATWYDSISVSLAAGTYHITANADCRINGNTGFVEIRLWDGSTIYAEGEVYIAAAGGRATVSVSCYVVLGGTTTVKISGAATVGASAATIEPTLGTNGTTNKATKIVAIKIA